MDKVKNVDEYILSAPVQIRERLNRIREAIREVAPEAIEKISYGMPYYGDKGRLAYFAYAKKHIGLYIPPPIIENHIKILEGYKTSKSAVQFPFERDIPIALVRTLVKARLKWNIQSEKKS